MLLIQNELFMKLIVTTAPTTTNTQLAKHQLQSKLDRRQECKIIPGEDSFTLEFTADQERLDKIKEWMVYCGWEIE